MEAVAGQPIKKNFFFEFSRVSTGAHPLTKKPEDSGYEIAAEEREFAVSNFMHTNLPIERFHMTSRRPYWYLLLGLKVRVDIAIIDILRNRAEYRRIMDEVASLKNKVSVLEGTL